MSRHQQLWALRQCGTLRDVCGTMKTNVPQRNLNINIDLHHMRYLAVPFSYQRKYIRKVYSNVSNTYVYIWGYKENVPQGTANHPGGPLTYLFATRYACGTCCGTYGSRSRKCGTFRSGGLDSLAEGHFPYTTPVTFTATMQ